MPNFPSVQAMGSLADVKGYLSGLDETSTSYLCWGLFGLTFLFLSQGSKSGSGSGDGGEIAMGEERAVTSLPA